MTLDEYSFITTYVIQLSFLHYTEGFKANPSLLVHFLSHGAAEHYTARVEAVCHSPCMEEAEEELRWESLFSLSS